MSLEVSAVVEKDLASPRLRAYINSLRPERVAKTIAPPLQTLVRRHLAALPANKRGWPSTGFWEAASRATLATPGADGVHINVNKIGVRQRFHGGHIAPVNARALAIPCSEDSYGKTPKDFDNLFVFTSKKGNGGAWLMQKQPNTSSLRLKALFKLVGGVDQDANPDVIPSHSEMQSVAKAALTKKLK